ncbi:hypothetical protein HMPREF9946_02687 [Acetobacteraceae bacterium AT-5844]|nr:hypothetical protein HMPREF9946_02687 [Acetobacteraceae bacterium AT-5844]
MNRLETLAARLQITRGGVPARLTVLSIDLRHTAEAVAKGRPDRLAGELEATFETIRPLFAAGFAGAPGAETGDIRFSVTPDAGGLRIAVTHAGHGPLLVWLLIRAIEAQAQTPPGAFERLLTLLDGDKEAARRMFDPLDFAADIARITVEAVGEPLHALELSRPPLRPDLAPIAAQIEPGRDPLRFAVPEDASLDEAVEHGFLTLLDLGVFSHPSLPPPDVGEAELHLHRLPGGAEFVVTGWADEPCFLAELLHVIADGEPASVRAMAAEAG